MPKIKSEVERRLAIARAATPGPWGRYGNLGYAILTEATYEDPDYEPPDVTHGSDLEADAEHIAPHDPADAVRRYEHALWILDRHSTDSDGDCSVCADWSTDEDPDGLRFAFPGAIKSPCPDILRLATSLGLETTD